MPIDRHVKNGWRFDTSERMASFLQAAHEKDYITLLKNNGLSDKTIEAIIIKVTV